MIVIFLQMNNHLNFWSSSKLIVLLQDIWIKPKSCLPFTSFLVFLDPTDFPASHGQNLQRHSTKTS